MPAERDPLSVRFDRTVRRVLLMARAAHGAGTHATVWVASPGPSFRQLDGGGRTSYERAFTRSAYYHVAKVPYNLGVPPEWSLKLTWGAVERRGDRYGRTVRVRLYRYGSGSRKANAEPRRTWRDNERFQSKLGARAPRAPSL